VAKELLKSLGLAAGPTVIACPTCGRTQIDVAGLAAKVEALVAGIAAPIKIAVMGCVVNGPGEARETDIGLTGGGNGKHMVYLSGITDHTVEDADMLDHIVKLVEAKAAEIEAADAAKAEAAA
jgi:(E)-4-hydroxy-3-methylbut-2-enyl-diphosphate synthase